MSEKLIIKGGRIASASLDRAKREIVYVIKVPIDDMSNGLPKEISHAAAAGWKPIVEITFVES